MQASVDSHDTRHHGPAGVEHPIRALALLPPVAVRLWGDGPDAAVQRLLLVALALAVAWGWAAVFARKADPGVRWWAVVFALTVVVLLPGAVGLGAAALALSFGTVFGREVFGGRSILPPALIGLAFGIFAFPDGGFEARGLDVLAPDPLFALSCLPGAIVLAWRGSLAWPVAAGAATGAVVMTVATGAPAWGHHLTLGAFAAGVVFLAAAPESTVPGRVAQAAHGLLVGALVVVFRVADPNHPEGIVFAALVGGLLAPLLSRALAWRPQHA